MINKNGIKELVLVKFALVSMNRMVISASVNRYLPLINYKRNIETESKMDLYGRQLIFQVNSEKGGKVNI
jgi:hypothetical protein